VVGADENSIVTSEIRLANYPNPFNPETTISFNIPNNQIDQAELAIYNMKGQRVRQFSISNFQFSIVWNGTDQTGKPVSSGIYFARMKAGKTEISRKMLLLK
jgi:flagellar hook assembly protein FlgD